MAVPSSRTMTVLHWRFILHGGCAETCPYASRQRDISRKLQAVRQGSDCTGERGQG